MNGKEWDEMGSERRKGVFGEGGNGNEWVRMDDMNGMVSKEREGNAWEDIAVKGFQRLN